MYTCTVEYGSILSTVLDNREHVYNKMWWYIYVLILYVHMYVKVW